MTEESYRPISCVEHEKLEFAALRRQWLWITYVDAEGARCRDKLRPSDVYTHAGAEWLKAEAPSGPLILRLDSIQAIESCSSDG